MLALALSGFNAGVQGYIGRWRLYSFALVLAALILLVIDFDRPTDGLIQVGHTSIDATVAEMRTDLLRHPGSE